ncbi:MAG: hypothetical protein V7L22_29975 [Nostoc sp.]
MNQLLIILLTLASLVFATVALFKEQSQHPFYLKIEVQYGK